MRQSGDERPEEREIPLIDRIKGWLVMGAFLGLLLMMIIYGFLLSLKNPLYILPTIVFIWVIYFVFFRHPKQ